MDRDLRLRAPHRRTARPADPPRQHPRDERRELSPRQQHCPKAATKVLRSDRSFWPKEANAPWHAPAIGKRAPWRRPLPPGLVLRRRVAGFCTAVDSGVLRMIARKHDNQLNMLAYRSEERR